MVCWTTQLVTKALFIDMFLEYEAFVFSVIIQLFNVSLIQIWIKGELHCSQVIRAGHLNTLMDDTDWNQCNLTSRLHVIWNLVIRIPLSSSYSPVSPVKSQDHYKNIIDGYRKTNKNVDE